MVPPLVSILVPAYNHAAFVERCLDSALAEPYANKELVVIDDGSTDGTAELIAAWVAKHAASLRIDYLRRGNRGIAATLNELAARANGAFLRLGASDDYFLPGGIQAGVDYLLANPGKLAVIGDCIVVDRNGAELHASAMSGLYRADKSRYRSDDGIRREIISRWAVGGPSVLLSKRIFQSIAGWSEDLRIDDWSFFLQMAAIDAVGFIDVTVGAYRLHGHNTSRTRNNARRIANLGDTATTARRHFALFAEPDKTLLRAQDQFIAAKIAFLQRRFLPLTISLLSFVRLRMAARMKLAVAGRGSGS